MITAIHKRGEATHARLTWAKRGLRVEMGHLWHQMFRPLTTEMLLFSEYPELISLFDGQGWNVHELHHLLEDADRAAFPEAVTLLITQKDINLLSEFGFSLA